MDLRLIKRFSLVAMWVATVGAAAWFGANWDKIAYFNDDDAIERAILADARRAFPSARGRADYFTTGSVDCVRFMPPQGAYAFVKVYCKERFGEAFHQTY